MWRGVRSENARTAHSTIPIHGLSVLVRRGPSIPTLSLSASCAHHILLLRKELVRLVEWWKHHFSCHHKVDYSVVTTKRAFRRRFGLTRHDSIPDTKNLKELDYKCTGNRIYTSKKTRRATKTCEDTGKHCGSESLLKIPHARESFKL
ncbi:hypothetical protein J6590_037135 [Homalodisca vitripennis]|nr:hypothetical protein J6590_037135 [Homalodisca vitripennis]